MNETLTPLVFLLLAGLLIAVIARRVKKKKQATRRLPHRTVVASVQYPTTRAIARAPISTPTSPRQPRRADDREYMNYRNCPDCHSENALNKQVIYKLAPHQFVCTVCGHKFQF